MTLHIKDLFQLVQYPPNVMVSLKYINVALPSGQFFSSRDAITYEVAKELANIIRPLVDQSPYHIRNSSTLHKTYQVHLATARGMHGVLQCQGSCKISNSGSSYLTIKTNDNNTPYFTKGPPCPSNT